MDACANGACLACQIDELSVAYGGHQVLADVNLVIPACQVTALVGPSGCGKSTLLACLNRLIDLQPDAVVSGRVSWNQLAVWPDCSDLIHLRQRIGSIAQTPNPFPLSIRRNFHLPLREHGVRARGDRDDIMQQCLRDVGLWDEVADRLDRSALTLSGGQQQRLCIARALALKPQAILLDEPTSALDPIATARVEEVIQAFASSYTIVLVTHQLAQARRLARTTGVFWLRDGAGRLVTYGPTEQVFTDPQDPDAARYIAGAAG